MKFNLIPLSLFLAVFIAAGLNSCKDIIEPSLKDRSITPEAPANGYNSANYNVNFWWDEVDDALKYRLQVVSPKFDSVGTLVLDTVVKTNKFTINLNPGEYQWRVRAENGSSQTVYSTPKSFRILYSSIKQQQVKLGSPGNGLLTNQAGVAFQWGDVYGATKYHLQIDTNSFSDENTLVYNQVIPGQQFNFSFPKDQTYQWRVRAENDTAQALWSTISQITYDHTPPPKVVLSLPAKGQTVNSPVTLQWNSALTAAKYKLYVFKADSVTAYNATFPVLLSNTSYVFTPTSNPGGTIYWKVSGIDAAGNEGPTSDIRSFVLQ
ncbi:hypothetical protein HQ865_15265 [Mucilaginibacter mali]|uniref:Fibronectin type-III domain-containing protein n=1 Tax=Mucilaginibacter mali TaxID=2740462 RepID=A0A7D4TW30_9SPHI|nr:hypothetical protein [Mucilaginibacter mali]QKJ31055.1 hypothetical protein HQ865_15265 [Mucilaginibacter mali]